MTACSTLLFWDTKMLNILRWINALKVVIPLTAMLQHPARITFTVDTIYWANWAGADLADGCPCLNCLTAGRRISHGQKMFADLCVSPLPIFQGSALSDTSGLARTLLMWVAGAATCPPLATVGAWWDIYKSGVFTGLGIYAQNTPGLLEGKVKLEKLQSIIGSTVRAL